MPSSSTSRRALQRRDHWKVEIAHSFEQIWTYWRHATPAERPTRWSSEIVTNAVSL